ncbi:hypothetical protein GCM10009691_30760 [Brevibacterium picturae]|uniref:Uncharacterized protein n=1 Tax=Brevibacterium picturae TaxID=260553 RepID=A0ABN2CA52_9MICO
MWDPCAEGGEPSQYFGFSHGRVVVRWKGADDQFALASCGQECGRMLAAGELFDERQLSTEQR